MFCSGLDEGNESTSFSIVLTMYLRVFLSLHAILGFFSSPDFRDGRPPQLEALKVWRAQEEDGSYKSLGGKPTTGSAVNVGDGMLNFMFKNQSEKS